jgi:hypothetical protein
MRAARGQGNSDLQTLTFAERSLLPRPSIKSRSSDSEVAAPSTSTRRAEAAPSGLDFGAPEPGRLPERLHPPDKTINLAPADFVADLAAVSARRDVFVCTAEHRRQTVAAALFLRHGAGATYLAAAAEPEGRARHAGTLLLWRGLIALQDAGVTTCDLGTIDTDRSPTLARFKLGAAAGIFIPCGTWTPSPL